MAQPDVDGALDGGASLVAEKFSRICEFSAPTTPETTPPREITARVAVACANALGESPIWSQRDNTLYWVSAVEGELWRWNCEDAPYKIIPRFGTTLLCRRARRRRSSSRRRGRDPVPGRDRS